MTTLQSLSRRGMRPVLVLAVASLLSLPVEGHSQVSENSNEVVDPLSSLKSMLSGPCGKYFGIDSCSSDSFKGTVIEVSGPDRLTVQLTGNKTVHVRLAGVKVPEKFAEDARQLLSSLLLTEPIDVVIFCGEKLPKGRLVGRVLSSGNEVNLELIRQGFAYFDGSWEGLASFDRCYYGLAEEVAKANRRGLWSKDADGTLK
jgi:endonuclease YncB( thermonuclease family)